jgi:hypothetical protein
MFLQTEGEIHPAISPLPKEVLSGQSFFVGGAEVMQDRVTTDRGYHLVDMHRQW